MKVIKEFSIFLGPRKSSEDDPSFEEIAKKSDKSADEMYIEFVHEAITSIMDRPSPQTQSSLDEGFSDFLKQPVWVNDPFLTYMRYPDRSYPGITFYPDKIVDRHGNPVDADFSNEKLIHAIGSFLGYILKTEWIRTLIVKKETSRDGDFIVFNNETVLDTRTNTMWARNDAARDNGLGINWADAKSYCEKYRGGGYTDWRMPTQDELAGLYESGSHQNVIQIAGFLVWASEIRGPEAATFYFDDGTRHWVPRSVDLNGRALPVRSGK